MSMLLSSLPKDRQLGILICEDEGLTALRVRRALNTLGYHVCGRALNGEEAVELARQHHPDVIMMDVVMPGMDGIRATERIMREAPAAVIVLTGLGDDETVRRAMDAGASGYLVKPIRDEQLAPAIAMALLRYAENREMQATRELAEQLQAERDRAQSLAEQAALLARTDELTGVPNRRSLVEALHHEIDRLNRYDHPFTVAFIDIDGFKHINDRLGHAAGDRLLREVAGVMRSRLRACDTVARVGGDEFALLLPETEGESGRRAVEKLREALHAASVAQGWPVSFSIGVVTYLCAPEAADEALREADGLMYLVKESGKNGIVHRVRRENPDDE
ncbi:MAG: diguanylate cyclase [Armatimonadota bacterium]